MEKISILEQYRKIIVLMNMDIKFFEARSIWQGYFFSVVIPSATPRELLKVAGFFREYDVFLIKIFQKMCQITILSTMLLKRRCSG